MTSKTLKSILLSTLLSVPVVCVLSLQSAPKAQAIVSVHVTPVHIVPIIVANSVHASHPEKVDQCNQPPVSWHWTGAYKQQQRKRVVSAHRVSQIRKKGNVVAYRWKRDWIYQKRAYFRNFPWEKSWWSDWKTMCKGSENVTLPA